MRYLLLLFLLSGICQARPVTDIAYGLDPLQKLDVYSSTSKDSRPVVIFIHGGSWTKGDKSNIHSRGDNFVGAFQDYVLVSANIRLMPAVSYREQAADVASTVKWAQTNIAAYGGDPERIVLFGYSSGAHLVALTTCDPSYLGKRNVQGVICFDVIAYDIPRAVATAEKFGHPVTARRMPMFFGKQLEEQRRASPVHRLKRGRSLPSFLIVYALKQGPKTQYLSKDQSEWFASALEKHGGSAEVRGFSGSHSELVLPFGLSDHAPTTWVDGFLTGF